MHLEATATAVLFGAKLQLGASWKPYWHHFGANFGHFVGDAEAK